MGNKNYQKQMAEAAAAKAAELAAEETAPDESTEPEQSNEEIPTGGTEESTLPETTEDQPEAILDPEVKEEAEAVTEALASEMETAVAQHDAADAVAASEAVTDAVTAADTKPHVEVAQPSPAALERFGGASAIARTNIDFLTQYAEEMHPKKPISTDRTRRNQRTLLRTIKTAIALPKAEDMIAVLDAFIKLIAEHRQAAFSEYYVFRDLANVELSQEEISQFTHLMQLFMVLSDPTERKTFAKTVDTGLVTKWILDEQVRSRFLAYCARAAG